MATYKINNTDITTMGAVPCAKKRKGMAVFGLLDFPARKGITEKDWGNAIEYFTNKKDIVFGERIITLRVLLKGDITSFTNACKGANKLSVNEYHYNVKQIDKIDVQKHKSFYIIEVPFLQEEVYCDIVTNDTCGDDGLILLEAQDKNSTSASTSLKDPAIRSTKVINLTYLCKANNFSDLINKVNTFNFKLSRAGKKNLSLYQGYVRDGFKVEIISYRIAKFTIPFRLC